MSAATGSWRIGVSCGLLLALPLVPGCRTPIAEDLEVATWQLANAEPVEPVFIGRGRLRDDHPLPDHLVQRLCDEFALITIARQTDFASVQSRARLPAELPAEVNLADGLIVGILATVGESASGRWPISLQAVRSRDGEGWIEATFDSGVYHPIRTAGYLELAYVPRLRAVRFVRINQRTFVIRPSQDRRPRESWLSVHDAARPGADDPRFRRPAEPARERVGESSSGPRP